jgi:hypothetical protein
MMTETPDKDPSDRSQVRDQIDENLRRVFDAAQSEPLPDRFLSLLDKLRAQEKGARDDD